MQTVTMRREVASNKHEASRGAVVAAVIGNALEFYDFTVYAFFAAIIGRAFFPSDSPLGALLLSVAAFGVGFLARPLGGIVIGRYADRVGRKPAMLLTLALMAVGMAIIALAPPYASIGVAAPCLIVLARLIQGFAWGGEAGPTTSFLVESAPEGKRARYASWQVVSQGLAVLAAGTIGVLASASLSAERMEAWGWRIPFALGLAVIPVGLILRRNMHETGAPADAAPSFAAATASMQGRYLKCVTLATLIIIPSTVTVYVNNYMTSYALTLLHFPMTMSIAVTMMVGACMVVAALTGGVLADRFGRKVVMIVPCTLLMLVAYPAFVVLNSWHSLTTLFAVPAVLALLTGSHAAAVITIIPETFPKALRSTGLSISYAIAATIFGGSTQFVVTWLLRVTGNPLSPAFYIIGACALGLLGMALLSETRDTTLE